MKRPLVVASLVPLLIVGSYTVFAQQQAPQQVPPQDQQMGPGMMGQGQMGSGMMGRGMMGRGMMGRGMMGNNRNVWEAPPSAAGRQNPVPADRQSVDAGKALFGRYCASCHGMSGRGNGVSADLTSPEVQDQTDGALFWKISQGRAPMPSFNGVLTPHQRWDLVNYIRTLASESPSTNAAPSGTTDAGTPPMVPYRMGPGMMRRGQMGSGMMGRGMMGGGMMGPGMMGRGMMMQRGPGGMGCPICGAIANGIMQKIVVPTSDGGVIVALDDKLVKYDNNLKKVGETTLDIDINQMHRRMQQMMQNCPVAQQMQQQQPAGGQGQQP